MSAHPIPAAALDDRLGFLRTSGSGKTFNAGTAVEILLDRTKFFLFEPDCCDPLGTIPKATPGQLSGQKNRPSHKPCVRAMRRAQFAATTLQRTAAGEERNRALVIGLEGIGAGRNYSAHSDTRASFSPFDRKRLIGAVRTAEAGGLLRSLRLPPHLAPSISAAARVLASCASVPTPLASLH
jgi:hypothetical protein